MLVMEAGLRAKAACRYHLPEGAQDRCNLPGTAVANGYIMARARAERRFAGMIEQDTFDEFLTLPAWKYLN